jgi:hypothetical protein
MVSWAGRVFPEREAGRGPVWLYRGGFLAAIPGYITHARKTDRGDTAELDAGILGYVTLLIAPFPRSSFSVVAIVDALQLGDSKRS